MAHFAEIDESNVVLRVIVVNNNELQDENGQESEAKGIAFCRSIFGQNTNWLQTSYSGSLRKNFAGVGSIYRLDLDAFIGMQPYPSWVLDENAQWQAPVPKPTETNYTPEGEPMDWYWSEPNLKWVNKLGFPF